MLFFTLVLVGFIIGLYNIYYETFLMYKPNNYDEKQLCLRYTMLIYLRRQSEKYNRF
jgi:hypothetical protein